MGTVDWQALRIDYESGEFTQSALERKYSVSRKAISNHAKAEQWSQVTGRKSQVTEVPLPRPTPLPIPTDALTIARIGLGQLARHLQTDALLPIAWHKSLSDALAQYVKVLVTAPQEQEERDGLVIPYAQLSADTRAAIRRLIAEDAERAG